MIGLGGAALAQWHGFELSLCVGRDESTGIGVFHRLHVEVEGDDFPIIVVLLGHWSTKELIKL